MPGRTIVIVTALWAAVLLCSAQTATAQEPENPTKAQAAEALQPVAYRLDYSVNELEDGKKINSRQYSMNLNAGDANDIKIGARVPVEPKNGGFQYLEIGTNIWCRLKERGGSLALEVRAEISNIAAPDQQAQQSWPVVRQVQINASTVVIPGKPVPLGLVDDPSSRRQFQLEVTVTKLR